MIYVGTSGWQYASWKGKFYPRGLPQREWLPFYAQHYETVEVNNTFYRLPERTTFERWAAATPPGFTIAVKASRFLTHLKRLREPEEPVKLFFERASALGDKLGPVLYQLPPHFPADLDRLARFLTMLPRTTTAAFEFRDASWDTDAVRGLLDQAGCALVLADRPGARASDIVTGGWSYIRFHQGQRTRPGYRRDKLRRWAERTIVLPATNVYVYFNNDDAGAAIEDSRAFIGMLREFGADVAA